MLYMILYNNLIPPQAKFCYSAEKKSNFLFTSVKIEKKNVVSGLIESHQIQLRFYKNRIWSQKQTGIMHFEHVTYHM